MFKQLMEKISSIFREEIFEMSNLRKEDTGIDGLIMFSTKMPSHGPRIKFVPPPGRSSEDADYSISISAEPRVVARSQIYKNINPDKRVITWVANNHVALLNFWNNGTSMDRKQVDQMIDNFVKVI